MIEELETQYVESVRSPAWIKHVARQHRIEVQPSQLDSETAQQQYVKLGIMSRLPDRLVFEQIAKWLHFRCIEWREITNTRRAFFAQHSGGNAHRIAIGLLFFRRLRFREDLITTTDQTPLFGRISS